MGTDILLLLPESSSILFNDIDTEFMNESRFEGEANGDENAALELLPWTRASESKFNVVTERMESRLSRREWRYPL